MPRLSINQLSEFTGIDRRTVKTRLDSLDFEEGPKHARLYDSKSALKALYCPENGSDDRVSLDEARRLNVLADTALKEVQTEEKRRARIPIEVVNDAVDEVTQAIAATIKATKGKTMDEEQVNLVFEQLRGIPARLKW